jgi:polar amino acid transport system permease protein
MNIFNVPDFFGYLVNGYLIKGAFITLALTIATAIGGMILGMLIALMRMSGKPYLAGPAAFYIWILRGTPLLVQLVIVFTGLPQLGLRLNVLESSLFALILNEAAYLAEIIRAGFMSVPPGQREAADALGLPRWLSLWKVSFPQAFRLMIPSLGNSINGLLKSTSITSVISMEELMRRSQLLMQAKFEVLEVFSAAAIYYLIMTTAWSLFQQWLERRYGEAFKKSK